ncbi:MAG: hypothetical protein KDA49_06380 [Rhodospirillaceae bacterium]|nr:hypothetical protein [Rhodospirillaceae bacterium]
MATLSQLQTWKAALEKARYSGVLTVRSADGESVTYRSDVEIAAAIREVDRQITAATTTPTVRQVRIASSKGL